MLDLDEIRKEVAIKRDIWIDKDDPVLLAAMVNEEVLNKYVEMLSAKNDQYHKAILVALKQGNAEAKAAAGKLIAESGNHASKQIHDAVALAMSEVEESVRQKFSNYLKAMDNMRSETQTARNMAYVAAGSMLVALIGTIVVNAIAL